MMVTRPEHADLIRSWGPSDPETVRKAVAEIVTTDLRADLAHIRTPELVLATWVGQGPNADSESVRQTFRGQLNQAKSAQLEVAPRARHFLMYDDPEWMFEKMDHVLGSR